MKINKQQLDVILAVLIVIAISLFSVAAYLYLNQSQKLKMASGALKSGNEIVTNVNEENLLMELKKCEGLDWVLFGDDCYGRIAAKEKDLSICDKYTHDKGNCYAAVGKSTQDIAICDGMTEFNEFYQKKCYAAVGQPTEDSSKCDSIADSYEQSDCYWEINLILQDPAVCAKIKEHYNKADCYENVAVDRFDTSFCEIMKDDTSRQGCYTAVAEAKVDPEVCAASKSQEIMDWCRQYAARPARDAAMCEGIVSAYIKDLCFSYVAEGKKDDTVCAKVNDQSKRNECYSNLARILKDQSICEKIQKNSVHDNYYDGCYADLAEELEDVSICEKIRDVSFKDICYSEVALRTNDPLICAKMSSSSEKKQCLSVTGTPVRPTSGPLKENQICDVAECDKGLTCEFNDDKGYSYCIRKPAGCGNGICDSGEDGANCQQDCCAKEGEVIDISGVKRCCEGLFENPNCIACAKNLWTCRKSYCGNGLCESSEGETAAICPLDCGWTGTCAKEGEMATWMTATSGGGYFRDCCKGLMQLADHGYDSKCNERRTWYVTLCVKKCGDGQCTKGENKCNCPKDCK